MIARLKLFTRIKHPYDFVFATFLAVSIYLSIDANIKAVWITLSVIFLIGVINKPILLMYALSLVALVLLIKHLTTEKAITKFISSTKSVDGICSMGPVIKVDGQNVLLRSKDAIGLWDKIHVSGRITEVKNFSDFDLKTYLETLHVKNIIVYPKIELLSQSMDIRSRAIRFLSEGGESYRKVAPLILLGKKTVESKQIYDLALHLNVVHLFVISGFHISLVFLILKKVLVLIKVPEIYASVFSLLPILAYLFILNFPTSATRATLLLVLLLINKLFLNKRFSSIQVLSVVMSVMLLINPFQIYSLSFIFTFIATYVIVYINTLKFKSKYLKYFAIVIGAYLSNVPIAIYINGWWSVFGLLFGIALLPPFIVIYVVSLFLFPFKDLLEWIYTYFILLLKVFERLNILITVPKIPLELIQTIYTISVSYLIINKIWILYTDKNPI